MCIYNINNKNSVRKIDGKQFGMLCCCLALSKENKNKIKLRYKKKIPKQENFAQCFKKIMFWTFIIYIYFL